MHIWRNGREYVFLIDGVPGLWIRRDAGRCDVQARQRTDRTEYCYRRSMVQEQNGIMEWQFGDQAMQRAHARGGALEGYPGEEKGFMLHKETASGPLKHTQGGVLERWAGGGIW
ncbi:uncharacterized protein LOC117565117 isoform X6 [Drosophila albomicans]|uniref:Uncharacterized protein LOC117565117 isoform X4 n=2 Tax=Drosophila albomicans TaxID=7291 RepID=A0A9C6T3X2_DROAB|nr:uncharacterized protein LOC117565117 isoform X4 [Drosophila albomicans]XP_051859386.1 uncharacterized protein LOC117565117 isoform X5 [Drosophila albomicans]XP_051859387.1 uncharacterized protein LOC117565117 isoform X6 [Drosophila albomicans]